MEPKSKKAAPGRILTQREYQPRPPPPIQCRSEAMHILNRASPSAAPRSPLQFADRGRSLIWPSFAGPDAWRAFFSVAGRFRPEGGRAVRAAAFQGHAGCGLALPGLAFGQRARFHQKRDFAADAVTAGQLAGAPRHGSGAGTPRDLGQLAGHNDAYGGTKNGFEVGQGLQDAVGEPHRRPACARPGLFPLLRPTLPSGCAARRPFPAESQKQKFAGGQSGGYQRAERRIGPGMGITATPAAMASATSQLPGVADAGHAGVGDDGDAPAGLQSLDQFLWRAGARLCWWQLTVGVESQSG